MTSLFERWGRDDDDDDNSQGQRSQEDVLQQVKRCLYEDVTPEHCAFPVQQRNPPYGQGTVTAMAAPDLLVILQAVVKGDIKSQSKLSISFPGYR